MSWNYRVVRKVVTALNGDAGVWLGIHEAYTADSASIPHSITHAAISPGGETVDDLRTELQRMLSALDKPVLEYDNF